MKLIEVLAALTLVIGVVIADKVDSGTYTYSDGLGPQDCSVGPDGNFMQIGDTSYLYNASLDAYIEHPTGGGSVQFRDQGYRYLGAISETGVCTLYPAGTGGSPF